MQQPQIQNFQQDNNQVFTTTQTETQFTTTTPQYTNPFPTTITTNYENAFNTLPTTTATPQKFDNILNDLSTITTTTNYEKGEITLEDEKLEEGVCIADKIREEHYKYFENDTFWNLLRTALTLSKLKLIKCSSFLLLLLFIFLLSF